VKRDRVGDMNLGPCAADEDEAEERAEESGRDGEEAREAEGAEDDADEVEGGLFDLHPDDLRHELGEEIWTQRRCAPFRFTVDGGAFRVNWRGCVRFSPSR